MDHVVVSRAGIFTVETKRGASRVEAHGNRLLVNGHDREKHLKQAYAEAMSVRDYLNRVSGGRKHFVTPLLVFTDATVEAQGKCRGVYVMGLDRLPGFVRYQAKRLDAKQRSAIAAALGQRVSAPA